MELQDFTGLKRTEKVTFPLNGVRYHCVPEVAAEVITDLAPTPTETEAAAAIVAGADDLANMPAEDVATTQTAGMTLMERMEAFFELVLEPDSHAQWLANQRAPEPKLTPAKRKRYLEQMITLPQKTAVFQMLVKHYAGRPTTPSSPSSNGDGGIGGPSTASAPAAG